VRGRFVTGIDPSPGKSSPAV